MKMWLCISFTVVMLSYINVICMMQPETKLVLSDVLLPVTAVIKFYAVMCIIVCLIVNTSAVDCMERLTSETTHYVLNMM